MRAGKLFSAPVLDFGCGDGAFSACIFKKIDIGVDIDQKALAIAAGYSLYEKLISFEEMVNALPDDSVGTVFSCSVLEHTTHLHDCIHQIARVLKPDAKFYFSVPNKNFTHHMESLVDEEFASNMNSRMYHRNLLDQDEWTTLLAEAGFKVETFMSFQPPAYTRDYFSLSLLGNKGLGFIPGVRDLFLKFRQGNMLNNVYASNNGYVNNLANYYVIDSNNLILCYQYYLLLHCQVNQTCRNWLILMGL
jgi:SAM-dependent methyltransferase